MVLQCENGVSRSGGGYGHRRVVGKNKETATKKKRPTYHPTFGFGDAAHCRPQPFSKSLAATTQDRAKDILRCVHFHEKQSPHYMLWCRALLKMTGVPDINTHNGRTVKQSAEEPFISIPLAANAAPEAGE